MLEPRRIETNQQPQAFELLGNGTYYYNYDISSTTNYTSSEEGDPIEETTWSYIQVHLNGIPEYRACAKAIIRQFIDEESEFSLINDYNAHQLGIRKDVKSYNEYVDYIKLVSEIKEKVKSNFK